MFPPGDEALYESLKAYMLTEEKLIESNYPVQHPEKLGCAVLYTDHKRSSTDGKTAVATDLYAATRGQT